MKRAERKPGAAPRRVTLQLANVRNSAKRRLVLEVFSKIEGHVTLEELRDAVHRRDASIGISTVYRTVRLLVAQGLAVERNFDGLGTRFERTDRAQHHDHLICRDCGRIVEFEDRRLEELQDQVAARFDFALRAHRHELYGVCASCQERGAAPRSRSSGP